MKPSDVVQSKNGFIFLSGVNHQGARVAQKEFAEDGIVVPDGSMAYVRYANKRGWEPALSDVSKRYADVPGILMLALNFCDLRHPDILEGTEADLAGIQGFFVARDLAKWCARQNRPILLRVGVEIDRSTLPHYPRLWRAFFIKVKRALRRERAHNVETVVSFTFSEVSQRCLTLHLPEGTAKRQRHWTRHGLGDFWPGDRHVDYVGFSVFGERSRRGDQLLKLGKPVIVCESVSVDDGMDTYDRFQHVQGWFRGFFEFLQTHRDVIKGFQFLQLDWNGTIDPKLMRRLFASEIQRLRANDHALG